MANIFPKVFNQVPAKIVIGLLLVVGSVVVGAYYYLHPLYMRVGYAPIQPVPFQHSLHVEQLGMDCRYCHTHVDRAAHSNVPDTQTCMNCHSQIQTDSPALALVRESFQTGEPIPWVRIHQSPDYVYFNHAVHVNRGISCVSCHGRVDQMDVVYHAETLSMGFCLDCHRNPEEHIRPVEHVYDLGWEPADPKAYAETAKEFVHDWKVYPPQSCSGCHR